MRDGNFLQATALIGGFGAGAGLMYLLDPGRANRDGRRRALIRDQTQSVFTSRGISDDVLVARVRARLGHTVSHPRAVCVDARDGYVTLTGAAPAREVKHVVSSVRTVPGVIKVRDRLDVYSGSSHMSDLQDGRHRAGARYGFARRNWPPAMRLIASFAGGALAVYGISRRSMARFGQREA